MTDTPDAELLIATGCVHCQAVLQSLSDLIKQGSLGRLEVSNIAVDPGRARELGVRSVPWTRIGPFILQGEHTPAELRQWAQRAGSDDGIREYIREQLKSGDLSTIEGLLQAHPHWLKLLPGLLENPELEIQVRIGLDSVIESQAGQPALQALLPDLARLSESEHAQIRGDATHYLALSGAAEAIPWLQKRLEDEQEDIREIAEEGLEKLGATQ